MHADDQISLSVVIPSYGRPDDLLRCLRALECQELAPHEVIVACRADDEPTRAALAELSTTLRLVVEVVDSHQQAVAMNAGVAAATASVVALTDDDAAPAADWLRRLQDPYADPRVGAVGGRDVIHTASGVLDGRAAQVGLITSYGRCIGNHHLGFGDARDVDFLKGVNLSVRRELWHLDGRLQGHDIQTHWEMDLLLGVRQRRLRVIYDPAIVVDHYPKMRAGADDRRGRRAPRGIHNESHNEFLALARWLPPQRAAAALLYATLVGSVTTPGLTRGVIALARRDRYAARVSLAGLAGRRQALGALLRGGRRRYAS